MQHRYWKPQMKWLSNKKVEQNTSCHALSIPTYSLRVCPYHRLWSLRMNSIDLWHLHNKCALNLSITSLNTPSHLTKDWAVWLLFTVEWFRSEQQWPEIKMLLRVGCTVWHFLCCSSHEDRGSGPVRGPVRGDYRQEIKIIQPGGRSAAQHGVYRPGGCWRRCWQERAIG